jgi:hypothetical protein
MQEATTGSAGGTQLPQGVEYAQSAPWLECQIHVHPELPDLIRRQQDEAVHRQLAIERLEALDGEWTIYTYGSAGAGFKDG